MPQVMKVRFRIEGLGAPGAAELLTRVVRACPGVVRIRLEAIPPAAAPSTPALVTVSYQPGETGPHALQSIIESAGFPRTQVI